MKTFVEYRNTAKPALDTTLTTESEITGVENIAIPEAPLNTTSSVSLDTSLNKRPQPYKRKVFTK